MNKISSMLDTVKVAVAAGRAHRFRQNVGIPVRSLHDVLTAISEDGPTRTVCVPGPGVNRGQFDTAENHHHIEVLAAIVAAINPATIFEFGTYLGVGTLTMAMNGVNTTRITTLDLPDQMTPPAFVTLQEGEIAHVAASRGRIGEAFLLSPYVWFVTQLRGDSMTLYNQLDTPRPHNVEMVVIDGGHSDECVASDSGWAFHMSGENRVILWDDYSFYHPGVVNVVNSFAKHFPVCLIDGTNYAIHSPKLKL